VSRHIISRRKTPPYDITAPIEVRKALAFVGIFTRVAKNEGLSTSHVLQAAKLQRPSRKAIAAIVREVSRIEKSLRDRKAA
jgi:hypothetical protein